MGIQENRGGGGGGGGQREAGSERAGDGILKRGET